MKMKYIIDKTNRRSFYLFEKLAASGENVVEYSDKAKYSGNCAFVFSPTGLITKETLDRIPPNSTIFYTKAENEQDYPDLKFINLLRQEKYCRINSRLTAEGALALTISSTERALIYSSVLVLGYGRLGKAIAETFSPLCKSIAVTAFTLAETSDAGSKYPTYFKREFASHLGEYDVVINTVPSNIIGEKDVEKLSPDALFLELASAPYGIAPALGDKLRAKYVLGSALPDKYSPESAGEALRACITSVIKEKSE